MTLIFNIFNAAFKCKLNKRVIFSYWNKYIYIVEVIHIDVEYNINIVSNFKSKRFLSLFIYIVLNKTENDCDTYQQCCQLYDKKILIQLCTELLSIVKQQTTLMFFLKDNIQRRLLQDIVMAILMNSYDVIGDGYYYITVSKQIYEMLDTFLVACLVQCTNIIVYDNYNTGSFLNT